ncbi:MAG: phage tail length tape measure family protein, partial [Rhodocyclaceae bacterium]|nr:phage tail length tape measure family protein [Rhodocyclaceae bacterium]
MTENRKVQLEAGMDVSGVEQGAERGKRAVRDMAQSVVQAGRDAGQGVEGLGQSSERSADKVAKAYGRIESEIRRVTAAAQAAAEGTGRSGELLNKAVAQGLDPGRIEPMLAKLREYEAAQKGVGISAGQMQAALRGVPAQFTDIATSLASGQKPMLVLLQQGGQLKDMFGGAGAAARALGGYILSLVNPYTLAAAAAGGLAAAYYQGSKEADAYARALILTGNAAGTSSGALAGMAVQIEAMGSATQGAAAEALALAAGTGKISGDNLRLVADAALRMQKTAGIAVSETIEQFAELGRAPVTASLKLNETTNHLTESVYRQIKALEDQGRMAEAAALAQSTYADALTSRAGQIEQNLGAIEKIWKGVAAEAKSAWDAMLGVGRTQTLQDRIRELETAQGRGFFTAHRTSEQDAELAALKAQAQAIDDAAAAKAKRNEQEKSGIALAREAEKHLDREAQKQRELIKLSETYNRSAQTPDNTRDYLAAVAGVMEKFTEKAKGARTAVKEVRDEYAELVNKLTAQDAGLSSSFWKDLETLHQQYLKTGDIDAYRRSVELLVTQQKFHQDTVKAAAAAEAEWAKSASAAQQAREKEIRSLEQKAQAAEDELRYYGLARSEIEALIVARLEERRAIESGIDGQEDVVSSLDREIAARRRLRDAYLSREVAAANEKAAQDSAKAWENFSRDIEQSLTDALMRGFESGEGFGENFVKTLQNTLKTAALKLAVQVVMQP